MLRVGRRAAPLFTCENMEVNIRHADVKSGERKNTHVTFTKKNVNNASKKFDDCTFFKKRGAIKPCTTMVEVKALIAPGYLVEIEATAVIGSI